jgi:hypothetical protein
LAKQHLSIEYVRLKLREPIVLARAVYSLRPNTV